VNKKKYVEEALEQYARHQSAASGYSILRYAAKGVIRVSNDIDTNVFIDWYPLNQAYVILRLAAQGKLFYAER
jgi:hypothetical protein